MNLHTNQTRNSVIKKLKRLNAKCFLKKESLQLTFKSLHWWRFANVNRKLNPQGGACLGKGSIPKIPQEIL